MLNFTRSFLVHDMGKYIALFFILDDMYTYKMQIKAATQNATNIRKPNIQPKGQLMQTSHKCNHCKQTNANKPKMQPMPGGRAEPMPACGRVSERVKVGSLDLSKSEKMGLNWSLWLGTG